MGFIPLACSIAMHSTFMGSVCSSVHPSLNPKPIYALHLFLEGLRCHKPTKPEIIHPYVANADLCEPLLWFKPAGSEVLCSLLLTPPSPSKMEETIWGKKKVELVG